MMLHDKILPGSFLFDYKKDCTNNLLHSPPATNKMDIYHHAYHFHNQHEEPQSAFAPSSPGGEVLDLSRRCDSVETRKTPSPYNSAYSYGTNSPSTHGSTSPHSTNTPQASTSSAPPPPPVSDRLPTVPPTPQDVPSLYPLYYPSSIKPEILSPPQAPVRSVIPSQLPMPIFSSTSSLLLQQALRSSPKSDDQKCSSPPSIPSDATSLLYPTILNAATTGSIHSGKATRPFNAFPRDPALVAAHFTASDVLFDKTCMERYSNFRKRALDDLRDTNGGHRIVTNPKMRRTNTRRSQNSECEDRTAESGEYESSSANGDQPSNDTNNNNSTRCDNESSENNTNSGSGNVRDQAYFERRRKNNAAAKKSRDRRRIKEDEIAIRAAYLERQNIELLCQIEALKKQLEIYSKV